MMDDERDPTLSFTYLADKGRIVEAVDRTLLVMTDGTIQRRRVADGAIQIIRFQAYAFDMSSLMPSDTVEPVFKPSERMTPELIVTESSDDYAQRNSGRFRSELHDRLTQPLYRRIRRVMPDLGALDLSPMVVLLIIIILQQAILPPLFGALM